MAVKSRLAFTLVNLRLSQCQWCVLIASSWNTVWYVTVRRIAARKQYWRLTRALYNLCWFEEKFGLWSGYQRPKSESPAVFFHIFICQQTLPFPSRVQTQCPWWSSCCRLQSQRQGSCNSLSPCIRLLKEESISKLTGIVAGPHAPLPLHRHKNKLLKWPSSLDVLFALLQ